MEEFKCTLFEMICNRSPGLDGLNPAFLKKIKTSLWAKTIPSWSHLAWIWIPPTPGKQNPYCPNPQENNPSTMKDFRLISLYNGINKIISKVLANRLKPILPKCISQKQSGFIENQTILDNVRLSSKVIHHMRCKNKGKSWEIELKIDISKAFYRVEWTYLLSVLRKTGFHDK